MASRIHVPPLAPSAPPATRIRTLFVFFLLAAGVAIARISQTLPAASHAARIANALGWEPAQTTRMDFDGIQGETTVWGAEDNVAHLTTRLRDFYTQAGLSNAFFHGEAMAWGIARDGNDLYRYLIADSGSPYGVQVYQMRQPAHAIPTPPRGEAGHRLEDAPIFPGSEPGLYIADLDTGTATEISQTTAPPDAVLATLASLATARGWSPAIPAGGPMGLFTKGRQVLLVSVYTNDAGIRHIVRVRRTSPNKDAP